MISDINITYTEGSIARHNVLLGHCRETLVPEVMLGHYHNFAKYRGQLTC